MTLTADAYFVLTKAAEALEGDGFVVHVNPSVELLPSFAAKNAVGAVAFRGKEKIALAAIARTPQAAKHTDELTAVFAQQTAWALKVVPYGSDSLRRQLNPASADFPAPMVEDIEQSFASAQKAVRTGLVDAGLVLAWATFEAAGRLYLDRRHNGLRLTAVQLLDTIAHEGIVMPDEAQLLRAAWRTRNAVAHGVPTTAFAPETVDLVLAAARAMMSDDLAGASLGDPAPPEPAVA
jgi:hypothetical protein